MKARVIVTNTSAKKTSPRAAALNLLERVEHEGAYVDRVLASPETASFDERDRRFIRELVIGVERHKLRLDRIIETYYNKRFDELDPVLLNILRLGLFQLIFMDSVPSFAAVNESVILAGTRGKKGPGGLVNAILRRFGREGEPAYPDDQAERLSIETSHPLWLVKRWIAAHGYETAEEICRSGLEKHPVYIRARRGKIDSAQLAGRLAEAGFETSSVSDIEGFLVVTEGTGLFDTSIFAEGLFTVQDPSAGIAAMLMNPVSGESVLDMCAAPGGKATQCAELMEDCGCVTAVDINEGRLGLVEETAERLGIKAVRCAVGDAQNFGGKRSIQFDRVLLDAPCSGTAVLAKRADMKWRLSEQDIERMSQLQRSLLNNAARLTKPGGILVYSTCSLEFEENAGNIGWFLEQHKEFTEERDVRFEKYKASRGYMIFPQNMGGTGAFAVKLKRKK